MPRDRHQARILAMQALCQWDTQRDNSPEALASVFASLNASGATAAHAEKLATAYWGRHKGIDRRISDVSTGWDLARMSPVDRNVMRIAIVEMLDPTVPPKVALNEAIEIGREYGGQDSPRFINGVLDAVLVRLKNKEAENSKPPTTDESENGKNLTHKNKPKH